MNKRLKDRDFYSQIDLETSEDINVALNNLIDEEKTFILTTHNGDLKKGRI